MFTHSRYRYLVALITGAILGGCGGSSATYTPSAGEAKGALTAALSAWRDGKAIDGLDSVPPVRAIDSIWRGGEKIDGFEILSETDPGDGTRRFKVRLAYKPPKEAEEAEYVVHGTSPVYVFREADYLRAINMDNNPAAGPSADRR